MSVSERIEHILVQRLRVQPPVDPGARFVEDLGADSLAMIELVVAFEESFDVEIPDDDAASLATFADAVDYVAARV